MTWSAGSRCNLVWNPQFAGLQPEAISQASTGIQTVNENVNQNNAVSDEISEDIAGVSVSMNAMATGSAQELSQLSENLKPLMGQFKIGLNAWQWR